MHAVRCHMLCRMHMHVHARRHEVQTSISQFLPSCSEPTSLLVLMFTHACNTETHFLIVFANVSQYDRDMQTATQAEKMRSNLSRLAEHASNPALKEALSRVRAVLKGGSVEDLVQAKNMLMHTEAEAKEKKFQTLDESPNQDEWSRGCEPNCGKQTNVFRAVNMSKYPYDERHGGHKWHAYGYVLPKRADGCICLHVSHARQRRGHV
jgi:hypothetical protein